MLQLFMLSLLAQTYMPNMAPSTYYPSTPVEKQEKMPHYYDPNQSKLPYYDPKNPTRPIPPTDINNPNPVPQMSDGQAIATLIQAFLRGVQSNDLQHVYDTLTQTFFRNATTFEQFKFFIMTHPTLTKQKGIYLGGSDVQYDTALVTLEITSMEDKTEKYDFYLFRDKGEWKILGILVQEPPPPPAPVKK